MTTPKLGIADYDNMKARTMAMACGENRIAPDEPQVLVHLDRVLRQGIVGRQPQPALRDGRASPRLAEQLARITGKAKSNLSRTLQNRVEVDLPITV